jgi:phosphatidylinositol alpha-mannosyltransferase
LAPPSPTGKTSSNIDIVGKSRTISFHGTVTEICYALPHQIEALAKELLESGADILHLHTPWTPLLPWQVWRKSRLPAVATFHATLPERKGFNPVNRILHHTAGYFMHRLDATIVPSTSPLDQLRHISHENKPVVLPPSIDLSPWFKAGSQFDKSRSGPVSVVFLGRLEERKGVDVLLKAWKLIAHRMPGSVLTIAGGGASGSELLRSIQMQADDTLRYIPEPNTEEARNIVAAADIFVAPSVFGESFGIVLIEAMAAGAVPIAAANTGYSTVMTGMGKSLLVPPGDEVALASKIEEISNDPLLRGKLRDWGKGHAMTYDIHNVGPTYEQLFQKVLIGQ